LVVLEEDELGRLVREGLTQCGEQQQGPVGGAALDDEVAGEAAPGAGVGRGVARCPGAGLGRRLVLRDRDAGLLGRVVRRTHRRRAGAPQPGPYESALLTGAGGLVDVGDGPGEAAPERG